jgi:hypothetical protein
MKVKKIIKETKENMGNNETRVIAGIYLTDDNEYWWITSVNSGTCKKLSTALKKINY